MKFRHAIRLAALTLAIMVITGCAWWQKTGKTVVSTVDDVARSMCAMFYGEQMGLSVDDAARIYCKTREAWAPWIDPALASMQAGADAKLQASTAKPADPEPAPDKVPPSVPATEAPQPPADAPSTPEAPDPGGGSESPAQPAPASGEAG